ncbi:MAG: DUF4435 domain-containing protein [Mycobacterium sp.]|nr:MAG: DUF4435 domain-containing protein [Mycobacterium sp.]
MRFKRLEIRNLRAVENFTVDALGDFVVVAGQNGCGKSCVFDAIRLLKSLYGGYQANEHLQWFGEFAINVQDQNALARMFRNPESRMLVSAELEFNPQEISYLRTNAQKLALPIAWQIVTGQPFDYFSFNQISVATQFAHLKPRVDEELGTLVTALGEALTRPTHNLSVSVDSRGNLQLERCIPAQVAFQAYEPDHLGIIEYHSASRAYTRQDVGGINLDSRQFQEQRRQHGLYNWQVKYQNIKTELASAYVRGLITSAAGGEPTASGNLEETLIDLFSTFFPEKRYLGARALPNGNLEFPVQLPSGRTHDIDDLSSGEKEILYGYLRLRNSIPKGSIILLDEPELHLNPSLLQGFADFYYRHLGIAQGNQIWMVTHSDALLRQAVGNANYHVFHMTPASADDSGVNQASSIFLDDELERATVDLVGDLATYQPHSKVVIFEGEGTTGFDVSMVRRLFPEFARRINLVSAGNKSGVKNLYSILEGSTHQMGALERFYAVTDRDHESAKPPALASRQYSWDRYHIENYLLEPDALRAVVQSAGQGTAFSSDEEVLAALKNCAAQLTDGLVLELLQKEINDTIVSMINVRGDPETDNYVGAIFPSIEASIARVTDSSRHFTTEKLSKMGEKYEVRFRESLENDTWLNDFPGRKILKRFVASHLSGISYEPFVNLVLDKLAEENRQPVGMKNILDKIMKA